MDGYNGWTNWDTWNVQLFLDNEEDLYKRQMAFAKRFLYLHNRERFDLDLAAKAVRLYLMPGAIKRDRRYGGGKSEIDRKAVNCHEIAQSILDDAIENETYEKSKVAS